MITNKQHRKTGIDALGEVPWGTHICQFFKSKEDLSDILVPFFKAGLADNEYCIWVTSDTLGVSQSREELDKKVTGVDYYIARGQLRIVDHNAWYAEEGKLDINMVMRRWFEAEKLALGKGFAGLRAAGAMSQWPKRDWANIVDYETTVDMAISKHRMLALCSYPLDNLETAELIDVVTNHGIVLVRQENDWVAIGNSRSAKVNAMKQRGLSYAAIGDKLGVTKQRASQLLHRNPKPEGIPPTMLTTAEVARLLSVHVNTIRRWSNEGTLRSYRVGTRGDRRFERQEIDNFLRRGGPGALSPGKRQQ